MEGRVSAPTGVAGGSTHWTHVDCKVQWGRPSELSLLWPSSSPTVTSLYRGVWLVSGGGEVDWSSSLEKALSVSSNGKFCRRQ